MKKKLIALLAAVAMVFSLAACGSTPDSVGTIGTVDITSGLYLLAQYDAYQKAADLGYFRRGFGFRFVVYIV